MAFDGKDLDEGVTVVDGPVRMVKEAGTVQKVAKLSSRESMVAPFHLGRRATPCLVFEHGPEPFGEFPVEGGIVRDHDDQILHEGFDGGCLDAMAGDHLVADSGERCHLRRNRVSTAR